ncbi:serine/threonine protein kinase, partial [Mycobacterium tuberculosis]
MAHELSAGSVFAGYRIERMLGAGGMGTVYLARNPDLPRSEALKVLAAELSRDLDFRARFVREADVAAGLDHPNIVAVHQRGQFEGRLWIAMQFVDGGNAEDALRAATMTTARAVYVIGEVAKALDYAHQQGVIHRDIKPANFLLSRAAGGDERVLLSDFGIARALGDTGLTSTGSVLATLAYAAPEVLAGQGFDGRADLYSLGCALFRLLTGEAPFAAAAGAA